MAMVSYNILCDHDNHVTKYQQGDKTCENSLIYCCLVLYGYKVCQAESAECASEVIV